MNVQRPSVSQPASRSSRQSTQELQKWWLRVAGWSLSIRKAVKVMKIQLKLRIYALLLILKL